MQIFLLSGNSDINLLYLTTNLNAYSTLEKNLTIFFEWVAFTGFTSALQYIFSAEFAQKKLLADFFL